MAKQLVIPETKLLEDMVMRDNETLSQYINRKALVAQNLRVGHPNLTHSTRYDEVSSQVITDFEIPVNKDSYLADIIEKARIQIREVEVILSTKGNAFLSGAVNPERCVSFTQTQVDEMSKKLEDLHTEFIGLVRNVD